MGYNIVDVAAATRRGILVTNTPGVLTDTTADMAWALMLGVARLESFNSQVRDLSGGQGRAIGAVSGLFLANGQRSALIDQMFAVDGPRARATVPRVPAR